jgi:NTP pyrophosphatase (non-canonical NTP hydrolase)
MTVSEYQKAADRTLIDKPDFELTDNQLMTVWCLTGLVGEVGELCEAIMLAESLDVKNHQDWLNRVIFVKKEIGDTLWYLAGICTKQHLSLAEIVSNDKIQINQLKYVFSIRALTLKVCRISENIKKGIFHQHGINQAELQYDIKAIYLNLEIITQNFLLDIYEIMQDNDNKLKERYPNGYNSQDSKKRVDVKGK